MTHAPTAPTPIKRITETLRSVVPRRIAIWAAPWLAATAGAVLISVSYSIAATHGVDQMHYAVFWLGILLFTVPLLVVLLAKRMPDRLRLVWLAGYALFSYVPKLLRDPGAPLYHDEIAHWRQAVDLAASGKLFQPNAIIGVIAQFPGLHIMVASASDLTGLTVWQCALLVLITAHVLVVLGAAMLGESVFGSVRIGVLVAFIYTLNSSFMYFDTELSYESLAVAPFIWCLACLAKAHRAAAGRERIGWFAAAGLIGATTITIHHLTALILALVLLLVAVGSVFSARHGRTDKAVARGSLIVFGASAATTIAWIFLVAPQTVAYLSPYFGSGLGQLFNIFRGSGGGRTLFAASTEPAYERIFAFGAPVLAGIVALIAVLPRLLPRLRRRNPDREPWPPLRIALSFFGLVYFPSVPFILVASGAEGARRSWAFSYLGLAVLAAPLLVATWDRLPWQDFRRIGARGLGILAMCSVLVGNVSAGLDESYRFPGPYVFGSDTRSLTPELFAAATWLRANVGPGQRIVTDRYTGLGFVYDDDAFTASPSAGFPAYDLFFQVGKPSAFLMQELRSSGYAYLVIDRRIAVDLPAVGVYFEPDEPISVDGRRINSADINQYQNYPWTTRVYESDNYEIYRFDFAAVNETIPGGQR